MTGNRLSKLNICLMAATVFAVVILAFVCLLGVSEVTAYAGSGLRFEISFDGTDWILKSDGGEIARSQGEFFDPQNNERAVSVIFKRAMDKALDDAGIEEYNLTFVLPSIGFTTVGSTVFDYTESAGGFIVKGIYSPVISSDVVETLQYKTDGGAFENYNFATVSSGGLTFGQHVNVGSYQVRFAVYEIFTFGEDKEGKDIVYRVPRYSEATNCTVEKATPDEPVLQEISIEYGTKAKDIASSLPTADGTWIFSETQTDNAVADGNTVLHVKAEAYQIRFDFIPRNQNYKTLEAVAVRVKVNPRTLRIVINDAFSLLGEPLVSDFTYSILTPLAEGDSVDGLGVEIDATGVDKDKAGEYVLTASLGNPDYVAYSMNKNNVFIGGGLYTVYATTLSAVAPDGTEFTVLLGSGVTDMSLRVELCGNEWWDIDFAVPMREHAYRFIFESSGGLRIYPSGSYTVTWKGGALDGAKIAGIVLADETVLPFVNIDDNHLTVDGNTDVIVFYVQIAQGGLSALEITSIVLSALIVVGGCIVMFVLLAKRKRIYRGINADIVKNDVYQHKNDTLNADCKNTADGKDKDTADKKD